MTTMCQEWLKKEGAWIGDYCTRMRKQSLAKTAPLTLVGAALLFGGLGFLGDGTLQGLLMGIAGGLFIGALLCAVYLGIVFAGLNPGRYLRKITQSVAELGMDDAEKETLGSEMLAAWADETQVLEYLMEGPKSNQTPAKVIRTPHYALQIGSTPYCVLVRMADITEVRAGAEQTLATTHSGSSKTHHYFTLYTIGFYRRDRFERELGESDPPDYAMGFFQENLRDQAFALVQEHSRV